VSSISPNFQRLRSILVEYRFKWYFSGSPIRKPKALVEGTASKITLTVAVSGRARINPARPNNMPPKRMEMMAMSGLMLTLLPTMLGVIMLPSRNCTTWNQAITPTAYQELSLVANANIAGNMEPMAMPMYGSSMSREANVPKNQAYWMPIIHNPTVLRIATMPITVIRPNR